MQPKRDSNRLSDVIDQAAIRARPLEQLRSLGSRSSSRGKTTAALLLGHKTGTTPGIESTVSRSCPGSRTASRSRLQNEFGFNNPNLQWTEDRAAKQPEDDTGEEIDQPRKSTGVADDSPALRDDHSDDEEDDDHGKKAGYGRKRSLHIKAPSSPQQEQSDDDESDAVEEGDGDETRKIRHIHPCMCDIDKRRWRVIRAHLKKKQLAQHKFEARLRQIEEEYRLAEEAELARRRQLEEEQELYGDQYEQAGVHRVRKKRSARRASMVSLGVKQIINWRKSPKIKVKFNKTSALRKENPTYCRRSFSERSFKAVEWHDQPKISIRTTKAVTLRNLEIKKKIDRFEKERSVVKYPNRPPFTLITCVF